MTKPAVIGAFLATVIVTAGAANEVSAPGADATAPGQIAAKLYELGRDRLDMSVNRGDEAAAAWYLEHAARSGHPAAMHLLALMAETGRGIGPDIERAARLQQAAAAAKLVAAQYDLGRYFENGLGVDRDLRQARDLYVKAGRVGHPDAQLRLAQWHECGLAEERHIVPRDFQASARWYAAAASQGSADAALGLGRLLEYGLGRPRNLRQAARLYRDAADAGSAEALFRLARLKEEGRGVDADTDAALALYQRAAALGSADALDALARRLDSGASPRAKARAMALWRRAAEGDHANAQFNLGARYLDDPAPAAHLPQAVRWLALAAGQGHPGAQYRLGLAYRDGVSVKRDVVRAHLYLSLAADLFPEPFADPKPRRPGSHHAVADDLKPSEQVAYNCASFRFSLLSTEYRDAAVSARDTLATAMTADELAEARQAARHWRFAPEGPLIDERRARQSQLSLPRFPSDN